MKKVLVLLSSYNGEQYLPELLESIRYQNGVSISLLVRDDGSTDNTLSILEKFKMESSVETKIIKGSNVGYLKSFWELINIASNADYYALCDQDDYWLPNKLKNAIKLLDTYSEELPTLYTSNVISVDSELKPINKDSFPTRRVISFADSLKKSVLPGCTFVFNNSLLTYLQRYKGYIIVHDWIIYLIAKAVGTVIYDNNPYIKYRLHGDNSCGTEIGLNGARKMLIRFRKNKTPCARSQVARDILCFKENMTDKDISLAENFANYKNSLKCVAHLLKYKEFRDLRFLFMLALKRV